MTRRSDRRADHRALKAYAQAKQAVVPDAFVGAQPRTATDEEVEAAIGDLPQARVSAVPRATDEEVEADIDPFVPMKVRAVPRYADLTGVNATPQIRALQQRDRVRADNDEALARINRDLDADLGDPLDISFKQREVTLVPPAAPPAAPSRLIAGEPRGGQVVHDGGGWAYSFLEDGSIIIVGAPAGREAVINKILKKGDPYYDAIDERRPPPGPKVRSQLMVEADRYRLPAST